MSKKEESKALWQLCFDDTAEFVEMYFRLKCTEKTTMLININSQAVAALQMLPYPMTYGKEIIPISYISGACTHPDYRGKGYMKVLLSDSFKKMYEADTYFSILIPGSKWLFDYYAQMGFYAAFRRTAVNIKANINEESMTEVRATNGYNEAIYQYINKKLAAHPCAIQHTEEDFKVVLEDLQLGDGMIYYALGVNKTIAGVAVIYKTPNEVRVNQSFADSPDIANDLFRTVQRDNGSSTILAHCLPSDGKETEPYGMARLIHVQKVLQLYAKQFPQEKLLLKIDDHDLPQNNGVYHITNGKCLYSQHPSEQNYQEMTIVELTQKVLSNLNPLMGLMMS